MLAGVHNINHANSQMLRQKSLKQETSAEIVMVVTVVKLVRKLVFVGCVCGVCVAKVFVGGGIDVVGPVLIVILARAVSIAVYGRPAYK